MGEGERVEIYRYPVNTEHMEWKISYIRNGPLSSLAGTEFRIPWNMPFATMLPSDSGGRFLHI